MSICKSLEMNVATLQHPFKGRCNKADCRQWKVKPAEEPGFPSPKADGLPRED